MKRSACCLGVLVLAGITGLPMIAPGVADAHSTRLRVMVGYADTLRADPANFPTPWAGAPKTLFIGQGDASADGRFDAGAIRLINPGRTRIQVRDVTVDLHHGADGASGPVFDLWRHFSIPARGEAILTQTSGFNFDTSDNPFEPVGTPAPRSDPRIPTVSVTTDRSALTFRDRGHVLDRKGMDAFFHQANESTQWTSVGRAACGRAKLSLGPAKQSDLLRRIVTLRGRLTNGCGEPLAGVRVHFAISSGPNRGRSRSVVTDENGDVSFRYGSSRSGTDNVRCTVTNGAGKFGSRSVKVTWSAS